MNIICSRNELLSAITGVGRAVSSKSPIPAMEGILFQPEENAVKLTAYDLEIGIITYCPAEVFDTGDIVINARLLGEILNGSIGKKLVRIGFGQYLGFLLFKELCIDLVSCVGNGGDDDQRFDQAPPGAFFLQYVIEFLYF